MPDTQPSAEYVHQHPGAQSDEASLGRHSVVIVGIAANLRRGIGDADPLGRTRR